MFQVVNLSDLPDFLIRFVLNTIFLFTLVRLVYYPVSKRKDYLFTFVLIGTVIFLLCHLLANVQLQLGFALGLFAVFGFIKYRTDPISIKEMTYLFIIIGLSVINALFDDITKIVSLLLTNGIILVLTFCMERIWLSTKEVSKIILYDKIELIKPENKTKFLEDLKQRTGINILRVEIGRIDFLHDTAVIKIYYIESEKVSSVISGKDNWKQNDMF